MADRTAPQQTIYAKAVVRSCKLVQPFSRNVADKEISIAASRGLPEFTQNIIRSSHGHSTPSLKISCKSVQPFCQNTKRYRQTTDDRQTTYCTKGATDSTVGQKFRLTVPPKTTFSRSLQRLVLRCISLLCTTSEMRKRLSRPIRQTLNLLETSDMMIADSGIDHGRI